MKKIVVEFTRIPIDAGAVAASVGDPSCGGTALFIGTTRGDEGGRSLEALSYEAYEAMALKVMERLAAEASSRWQTGCLRVVHRLGRVGVGEASIVIAAAAPHRSEAFEACRFLIDRIKTSAPIWKKDLYKGGEEAWVGDPRSQKG